MEENKPYSVYKFGSCVKIPDTSAVCGMRGNEVSRGEAEKQKRTKERILRNLKT
jgi:hypothetical protein